MLCPPEAGSGREIGRRRRKIVGQCQTCSMMQVNGVTCRDTVQRNLTSTGIWSWLSLEPPVAYKCILPDIMRRSLERRLPRNQILYRQVMLWIDSASKDRLSQLTKAHKNNNMIRYCTLYIMPWRYKHYIALVIQHSCQGAKDTRHMKPGLGCVRCVDQPGKLNISAVKKWTAILFCFKASHPTQLPSGPDSVGH